MHAIKTEGIHNPRRSKRVRKYYARLVTELERNGSGLLVEKFYRDLSKFPGVYRLGVWHYDLPRKRAAYRKKRWLLRAHQWRQKNHVRAAANTF